MAPSTVSAFIVNALIGTVQLLAILAVAPLITGIMRKVKAKSQKRFGSSIFQPYFDLVKLLRKDEVVSNQSSWLFRATPFIVCSATLTAAVFIPTFFSFTPLSLVGDLLLVVGLFSLARFFTMLAGLDVASTFGGLGASREMMLSALVEPALFITIFPISLTYGGTNVSTIVTTAANGISAAGLGVITPAMIFSLISFLIVLMGESGRIPFDNPATHLELTMVHEAMILEYSGRSLALIEFAQSVKMVILMTLIADIFLPFGISTNSQLTSLIIISPLIFVAKIVAIGLLVAYVETRVAKWRLFRLPDLLVIAMSSSLIGIMFFYL